MQFAKDVVGWSVVVVGGGGWRVKKETTEILPNNLADYVLLRVRVNGSEMG